MKNLIWILFGSLLLLLFGGFGCSMGNQFGNEFGEVIRNTVEMIKDQGVIDDWISHSDANVQDPGVETYVELRMAGGVRAVGMNGRINIATGGQGTRLPPELRAELIRQLDTASDEQRAGILQILGWNRAQVPGSSTSGGTELGG